MSNYNHAMPVNTFISYLIIKTYLCSDSCREIHAVMRWLKSKINVLHVGWNGALCSHTGWFFPNSFVFSTTTN